MRRFFLLCALFFSSFCFSYPFIELVPDTTIREGESCTIYIRARSWMLNALEFSILSEYDNHTLTPQGRIGGCTCSETIWGAVLTVNSDYHSSGVHQFIVTVIDTEYVSCSDTFLIEILNVPLAPVTIPVEGQLLFGRDSVFISLDEHVNDPDHSPSDISWSVLYSAFYSYSISTDRVITVFNESDCYGIDSLVLEARDPDGETAVLVIPVEAFYVNLPPSFERTIPDISITSEDTSLIDLLLYVYDPDTPFDELTFNVTNNSIVGFEIRTDGILAIFSIPGEYGTDSLWLFVSDSEYSDSMLIVITVHPESVSETPLKGSEGFFVEVYPNPSRGELNINTAESACIVTVCDALGRLRNTFSGNLWDGKDRFGKTVPEGFYLISIKTDKGTVTKKVFLTR